MPSKWPKNKLLVQKVEQNTFYNPEYNKYTLIHGDKNK